jgi:hypothetical protein
LNMMPPTIKKGPEGRGIATLGAKEQQHTRHFAATR